MCKKILSALLCVSLILCIPSAYAISNNSNAALVPAALEGVIPSDGIVSRLSEYENTPNVIGYSLEDGSNVVYILSKNFRTKQTDGTYTETATLSSVTSLEPSEQTTLIYDSFVAANRPTTNYGTSINSYIGTEASYGVCRQYTRFDGLSNLGIDQDLVTSAVYHSDITQISGGSLLDVYLVTGSWSETAITWNNKPNYDNSEIITTLDSTHPHNTSDTKLQDFYITRAVKGWLQGLPNYGIMIKEKEDACLVRLDTFETTNSSAYLAITYFDDESTEYVSTNSTTNHYGTKGITSGTRYYIYNKKSEKFLTADSTSAGAGLSQYAFNDTGSQKWILTYNQTSGYYTIKSAATGFYLQVNGTTAYDLRTLKMDSGYSATGAKWTIVRNWDGSYQINTNINTAYSITVAAGSTADGAFCCLYQHTVDHNKQDDWTIIPVANGTASVYDFHLSKINTTSLQDDIHLRLSNMGFNATTYTSSSTSFVHASEAYERLKTDSFFGYFGHGNRSQLGFCSNDDPEENLTYITGSISSPNISYALSELPYNQLSQLKIMLNESCCTGRNDEGASNFVGTAYDRGAHFVTAHVLETYSGGIVDYSAYWKLTVMMNLAVGNTIYEGLAAADDYLYNTIGVTNNLECRHTLGDNNIKLYFASADTTSAANVATVCENTVMSALTTQTIDGVTSQYYKDTDNNLYGYDSANQQLNYYIASVNSAEYGNQVVSQSAALSCASNFLEKHDISVAGYTVDHSNAYAKDFRIVYENDNHRMALKLQANDAGEVIVTNFFTYNKEVSQ